MRQLTFVKAKQPLQWREVAEPTLKGQGKEDALVRPIAVASCDLDAAVVHGRSPWQEGPFAFGHEFVGEIVAVGEEVTDFKPGQRVIVPFQISCGKCNYCLLGLTGSCSQVKTGAMYGLAPVGGEWGGALSDLVHVPFAQAMLIPLPDTIEPATVASLSDNISDAWRTVAPYLEETPGGSVLISGGGSIGLYAVGIARALAASQIDYVDKNPTRLALAEKLGANPIELGASLPKRFGKYSITVDASANPELLASVLRSTDAGGVCTSIGIYFTPVALPLFEMYTIGVTFKTNRVHSRVTSPKALQLITSGRLQPELVTTDTAGWDDANEAFLGYQTKLVMTR